MAESLIATVRVEAEHDRADPVRETDWLAALSSRDGLPTACVAWARLDAPNADAVLAADFPGMTLLLSHTGLPADRSEAGLTGWRRALEALARQPSAALKVSGLVLPGRPWTLDANRGVIRDAVAIFGPDCCLFASNFPVDGLCSTVRQVADSFLAAIADRPEAERRALLAGGRGMRDRSVSAGSG